MKKLILALSIVLGMASQAIAGPYPTGVFAASNYSGSFNMQEIYNNVQLWELDATGTPVGPTMVYYGTMLDHNENFVSCLALAFFPGNDATEIQYVHKMWGLAPGQTDCQYGRLNGFAGNTGKCIMDPAGKTRYMGPKILDGIKPFLGNPGIFARVVDLDYQRPGRNPAPRAGLIKTCKHPAVHKGLAQQKPGYDTNGRLGAGLHYAVIHNVNGQLRFTMRSRRTVGGKPNNRIYTVNLSNPVDTSAASVFYPTGMN